MKKRKIIIIILILAVLAFIARVVVPAIIYTPKIIDNVRKEKAERLEYENSFPGGPQLP